ncbi:ArsR/SmtB family transcription factor [Polaribacter sp. Hel1_85]|uniref:ArsR/SmtB family transcription factor n=1 Tax=Polaribacter sp. Hel1_85 TaxID=1250005 RepID=UPI00052C5C60|nr:metalloregulator ArsR/SmtB family transcription factor [Polaribacter sp. Hel1_85]KGL64198.1 transcriptional regulator, ArsR family [Polaribacter sp. Hel1_85]
MGLTKSEIFTDEQNEIAAIAKVLGHPARIAILDFIIKLKSCVCGDLVKDIGLAQPTISQHLKELKKVGIIKGTVEGTSVCYCIDEENWEQIKNRLNKFLNKNPTENCC